MWDWLSGAQWLVDRLCTYCRDRQERIDRVVDRYEELAGGRAAEDTGASAFIRAGAGDLRDDSEVRDAVEAAAARVRDAAHPWGGFRGDVPEDADWKEMVDRLVAGEEMREIVDDLRD